MTGLRRRALLGAAAAASLAGCAPAERQPQPGLPRIAPLPTAGALRTIAFGSCMDQTKPQPIWNTVLAERPDLVIFGGDNVYASDVPWSLEKLQRAYAMQAAVPEFARLRERVPHLAIWDDHDYGLNDGGAEFAHKAQSKEAFLRFWQVPERDERRHRDGIYHSWRFGPPGRRVQVILLDTRWFRSPWTRTDQRDQPGKERYVPDASPGKTMLGEAQWLWLEGQLQTPADVRLIVSGTQVVPEGHGWERWGNFPHELERLQGLIRSARAGGVVFLSGDRHLGAIYRAAGSRAPYPLYELTSSGITHPWRDANEAGPNRMGRLVTELHYGTVEIDWAARRLRLALKNLQGAVVHAHDIPFSELSIPT